MRKHRNIPPAVYNEKRKKEKPIPNDESDEEHSDESGEHEIEEVIIPADSENSNLNSNGSSNPLQLSSNDGIDGASNDSNDFDLSQTTSVPNAQIIPSNSGSNASPSNEGELNEQSAALHQSSMSNQNVSIAPVSTENTSQSPIIDNTSDNTISNTSHDDFSSLRSASSSPNAITTDVQITATEVKDEHTVPMYEVHRSNNQDILQQLEEWVVDFADDDIEITISTKGYGVPLRTTVDGLVKPEVPDEFSGMFPCLNTVLE